MSKKIKLLFAAVDIGWRIDNYSDYLRKKFGYTISTSSFIKQKVKASQYKTSYDFEIIMDKYPSIIQWIFSLAFFLYAVIKFDTFYFFSGETLLTRKLIRLELKIYKLLNRKIIMHFVGSDIRDPNYLYWKSENLVKVLSGQLAEKEKSTNWQRHLIKVSEQNVNTIFVSTPDLKEFIASAIYIPVFIDVEKFLMELKEAKKARKRNFQTEKVKILHAPSNAPLKGSEHITKVMESLAKKRSDFEYIDARNLNRKTGTSYTVSRYDLFQLYLEADIVIDQMVIGWYGLQSVEALLSDCKAICYIEEGLKQFLEKDCPIIASNILELEDNVCTLIDEHYHSESEFNSQKEWVKKNHSIESRGTILEKCIS